jgi:hypothetical protein
LPSVQGVILLCEPVYILEDLAMKDTFYFSHDYNARSDEKIKLLIRKHGIVGYGIFWAIVEDLYNNANALRTDYEGIAFDLRTDENIVKSIINEFDLFVIKDGYFGSMSVQNRLEERSLKSKKAQISANIRWSKDANALRTESDGNAKKERKGNKKSKETINTPTTLQKDDVHESYQDIALDQKLPFRFSQQAVRDFFKSEYEANITDPDSIGFADIGTYITKNGAGEVFLDNIRRFKHLITFQEYKHLKNKYKIDNKYIKNVILQCEEIPKYISQSLNNTIIRWSNKEFNK